MSSSAKCPQNKSGNSGDEAMMSAGEMLQLKGLNVEIRGCATRVVQSLLWKKEERCSASENDRREKCVDSNEPIKLALKYRTIQAPY